MHLNAVEHHDRIVFLHRVQPGPANQSYGIEVASLAGIPASVVRDARRTLLELEAQSVHHNQNTEDSNNQSDFFDTEHAVPEVADNTEAQITGTEQALIEELAALDPDSLTPRQALDALYHLKNISRH